MDDWYFIYFLEWNDNHKSYQLKLRSASKSARNQDYFLLGKIILIARVNLTFFLSAWNPCKFECELHDEGKVVWLMVDTF